MGKADITFSDYICGGYYITRLINKPACMSDLLPDKLFSISSCIGTLIPDAWTLSWTSVSKKDRIENAKTFDLSNSQIKQLTDYCDATFDKQIDWPGMCLSLDTAAEIVKRFLSHLPDVIVVGIGLHNNDVQAFVMAAQKSPDGTNSSGLYKLISKDTRLDTNGTFLSFEPLIVLDAMITCSWLCNELPQPVYDKLATRPNQHGFIDGLEVSHKCTDFIGSGDVGAEPGLWLPWLIVQYHK